MDKLTSLNLSFDRVVIQFIIPGLIAIFPWFLLFIDSHPLAKEYFYKNSTITITTLVFISLICGLLLENLGGRLEVEWFDKVNKKKYPTYDSTWEKYLQLHFDGKEPVGQRYLRNILLRMKFELSAGIALLPMSIGLAIFHTERNIYFPNTFTAVAAIFIIPCGISFWLVFKEARSSSKVLAKTRKLLVDKYYS